MAETRLEPRLTTNEAEELAWWQLGALDISSDNYALAAGLGDNLSDTLARWITKWAPVVAAAEAQTDAGPEPGGDAAPWWKCTEILEAAVRAARGDA